MRASISESQTYRRSLPPLVLSILTLMILSAAPATFAQSAREQVAGVQNFGRVTDRFFRGGEVTPAGVRNLARMGVRTIIDLRDSADADEPAICRRHGIKYFNFPMSGHDTPDDQAVGEILSIIQSAKEPVYVHCSAGKRRSGTIAALYRIRVQGWSEERAWAEQQSYGFGTPQEHPELYAYVYSARERHSDLSEAQVAARSAAKKGQGDTSAAKSQKKDDDDDAKVKEPGAKEGKKKKGKVRSGDDRIAAEVASQAGDEPKAGPAPKAGSAPTGNPTGLSADAGYLTLTDAIRRARAEGGSGDVLKVDLEWDRVRSVPTWDVTFSSGTEYEIDAVSGKLLGVKPKSRAKLAVFSPLPLPEAAARGPVTFREVLRKAETSRGQTVMQMELKRVKGRTGAFYEVVLADGATLFYDAATGSALNGL